MATDKAGLGDKYDKQGGEFVNKQLNNVGISCSTKAQSVSNTIYSR